MNKNVILWIEDCANTINELIPDCEARGLEVIVVDTPGILHDRLVDVGDRLMLFILDIMLEHVDNLSSLDIPGNTNTNNGYNAGWILLDKYLVQKYPEVPVLIVSTRAQTTEGESRLARMREKQSSKGWIYYIEKQYQEWYEEVVARIEQRIQEVLEEEGEQRKQEVLEEEGKRRKQEVLEEEGS